MNFERIYEYRFQDVDQTAKLAVWGEIARWLYRRSGSPERVLDPAAGSGEFIAAVPAAERWAVDLVDHGITALPGVKAQISAIEDADLPDAYFDLIYVSNLLEHLPSPDAVASLLVRFKSLLRVGGRLMVMGPNFKHCSAEYFDCSDHILALTERSVAEHLYGADLAVSEVIPRFLPFSFRSRLPASARLTRLYLSTPAAWRVLGQQFLVTAVNERASQHT
jgi:2-polyprenyl-3-methyl-5-hydroxy-6-metoxy-1,4-benzoquinol methylase